jgi:hypothetical protein
MHPIKPKGLSLGLGFQFFSIRVLSLGILKIFYKFLIRLFKKKIELNKRSEVLVNNLFLFDVSMIMVIIIKKNKYLKKSQKIK